LRFCVFTFLRFYVFAFLGPIRTGLTVSNPNLQGTQAPKSREVLTKQRKIQSPLVASFF
jgi:hypothetical protein